MRRLVAMAAALLLLCASTSVLAGYDSTYYPAGVRNPLIKQDLYFKNAIDVLEHLDAFESGPGPCAGTVRRWRVI